MSRLRELMEELCPNGVEYKKLGDVVSVCRGVRVVRAELQLVGKYPVYQNSLIPMGYYDKENCIAGTAFIIGAGAAGDIGYSDVPFWAADDCFYFVCEDNMNARFLYYVLVGQETFIKGKVRKASIPRLSRNVVEKMVIPVPPLEIQNEIVKLLDNFTKLTAELTEQLMTELTLRKKQYNFYRDSLLNFVRVDDTIVQTDRQTDRQAQRISKFGRRIQKDVVWRTLGDIGTVCMCKRILKQQTNTESGIPFYKIGTFGKTADSYISEELFAEYKAKYSYPRKGEILISAAGTIGRSVIYDGSPAYFQDSNIVWIANDESVVLNRYLYYFYSLFPWRVAEGGTVARLYNDQIQRTEIPVPPIEVQQKIVSILDRFDALCNDLTSVLPAEIAARKKQYEHYRDKLLTFPRSKLEERS